MCMKLLFSVYPFVLDTISTLQKKIYIYIGKVYHYQFSYNLCRNEQLFWEGLYTWLANQMLELRM